MDHIVLNKDGYPFCVGDSVRIEKEGEHFGKFGEIDTIRNYDKRPRIGVLFDDANVCSFAPEDLLAT
ncbi:hypothetical protein [Gilvimarinus japonicus]|uniref:KOW domain-containing protein n=1 Tax=Gilvimarinus japonicus TaxID=1796469 RepID=A0ABV7HLW3_9GAMM